MFFWYVVKDMQIQNQKLCIRIFLIGFNQNRVEKAGGLTNYSRPIKIYGCLITGQG